MWGGIDSYKEERRPEPYLAAGFATLGIDMPGVADAPLAGSTDAERMWDPIFDWAGTRVELDPDRVAVIGNSTGGYWASKLSRTYRNRIRAAVCNGGPVHDSFTPAWIARAQVGEYPFELAETLAAAFGGSTYDDWVRIAPSLSLLDLGILDRPGVPLLAVHGEDDTVFPPSDARRLIAAGADGLIVPGGHMGTGDTAAAIVRWLRERLRMV
jgi:pimeloyl-ACP methyl ester carboxylesterase